MGTIHHRKYILLCAFEEVKFAVSGEILIEDSFVQEIKFPQLLVKLHKHFPLIALLPSLPLRNFQPVFSQTAKRSIILFLPTPDPHSNLPPQLTNLLVIVIQLTNRADSSPRQVSLQLHTVTDQFQFGS